MYNTLQKSQLRMNKKHGVVCVIDKHLRNPFMVSPFTNEFWKHGKNKKPNARKWAKLSFMMQPNLKTKSLLKQERIILHALGIIGDN